MNKFDKEYFQSCLEMQKDHYAAMLQRNALLSEHYDIFLDYISKHVGRIDGVKIIREYSIKALEEFSAINEDGSLWIEAFAFSVQSYTKTDSSYMVEYMLHEYIEDYKTYHEWAIIIDIEYKKKTFDEFLSDKQDISKWINELLRYYQADNIALINIKRYARLNDIKYSDIY